MIRFTRQRTLRGATRLTAIGLGVAIALAGTTAAAEPATVLVDHPLAGQIWSSHTNRMTTVDDIVAAGEVADAVMLGEKHDNAEHHRLQAVLLDRLSENGRDTTVIWEMIAPTRDPILARAAAIGADRLGAALGWAEAGWPSWPEYQPIAEIAIARGLAMRGAALPRDQVGALVRGDSDPDLTARPLSAEGQTALLDQLEASHCGAVPRTALGGMATVQVARDAAIAEAMRAVLGAGGFPVVVTGGGHARRDRGVPWQLPRRTVLVVGFVEVVRGELDPATYIDPGTFDFVWFTPRVDEKDPCERFRR
jgi:uncharacterized iron-regulated protein